MSENQQSTPSQGAPSERNGTGWPTTPAPLCFPPNVNPLIKEAMETFSRELDSLLLEHDRRQWVVYHGSQPRAISGALDELYVEPERRGIPSPDLFYHRLSPIVTRAYLI